MLDVGDFMFRDGTSQDLGQVVDEACEGLSTWGRDRNLHIVPLHRRVIQTIYANTIIGAMNELEAREHRNTTYDMPGPI